MIPVVVSEFQGTQPWLPRTVSSVTPATAAWEVPQDGQAGRFGKGSASPHAPIEGLWRRGSLFDFGDAAYRLNILKSPWFSQRTRMYERRLPEAKLVRFEAIHSERFTGVVDGRQYGEHATPRYGRRQHGEVERDTPRFSRRDRVHCVGHTWGLGLPAGTRAAGCTG